ncbi:lymphoid-restricted membrane protein [Octodon degus]|uniref:Lymphoid-restricted membrane protein n=1 Tax=Octodon degus TaxID=10160 RepID=A0A6P6EQT9_OCTDE|nr:lymphoid-restricted membrane protein [Octodon degus]
MQQRAENTRGARGEEFLAAGVVHAREAEGRGPWAAVRSQFRKHLRVLRAFSCQMGDDLHAGLFLGGAHGNATEFGKGFKNRRIEVNYHRTQKRYRDGKSRWLEKSDNNAFMFVVSVPFNSVSLSLKKFQKLENFPNGSFQWVTNPEITVKEKWVQQHPNVLDEGFSHLDPLSATEGIQQPLQEKLIVVRCPDLTGVPNPGPDLSVCIKMNGDLSVECHQITISSVKPIDEVTAIMIHLLSSSPGQEYVSRNQAASSLEGKEEPKTIEKHRKECAAGETEVSPPPVTTGKSVNFRPSDNTSANEREVEAEFLRLSLGFKCDWFTLEKRVKLEERSRDLAEENLKKEITNCLKLLESLTPLCEEDNQAQELIKKLENSITFLSQCTTRVASRAEMLGAINQESRVSKAVEVMIQHVENLKRMYAKEHAELEELKQVLLQNERSFNPLEDGDDCHIKKRSASLNSKPSSLRRVTIASLPRNIGNAGMVAAMENERFSRRSSSWRLLGPKQSEHRPSLHRFISTHSWADAEDEKCELKTKEDSESPREEVVERTRKPSLSERKNIPSKWDFCPIPDTLASWVTNLGSSVRKANKAIWLSVVLIVVFAALMSLLAGRFFQRSVDATATEEEDSWVSLEHILWPFTTLQQDRPPPV